MICLLSFLVFHASSVSYSITDGRNTREDAPHNLTVFFAGLSNPEGFAIDWLSRNMYFTSYDEDRASISVAKLDGAFRTKIIITQSKQSKLNSIAVHPKKGSAV